LNISDKITNEFKEYTLNKNEDKFNELIKEVLFQFISIGLAKIDYLFIKEKTRFKKYY
jgi:hypothetical protein